METKPIAPFQAFNERGFTQKFMYRDENSRVFILNFLPGQQMREHYHPGTELYFNVLQGKGIFTVDGVNTEVTKDDTVHCTGTEKLGFTNTGTDVVSIHVVHFKVDVSEAPISDKC